ncbi:MAG: helix-turn-helix transcriptional regulator [Planctomycetes bacterium]|nr:helix-turn-helix transcriptional regulator [Planctomycetota bacterium]
MRALEGDSNQPPLVLGVSRPYLHSSFLNNSEEERIVARAKIMDLGPLSSLTQRELEVLALIGEGLSTAEIAKRLSRSTKTVEWHRTSLGRKLEASNRVELAHIAIRAGLADFLALGHASRRTPQSPDAHRQDIEPAADTLSACPPGPPT